MDERTFALACAALEEFLRTKTGGRNGKAVEDFLAHMSERNPYQRKLSGTADTGAYPCGQPDGSETAAVASPPPVSREQFDDVKKELDDVKKELGKCKSNLQQAERKNQALSTGLAAAQEEARDAREAARMAQNELSAQKEKRLREQDELFAFQQLLDTVPQGVRELVLTYFNTGSLTTFLIQCGQFNRINQLWEACGRAVIAGQYSAGMADFLERLLELFNRGYGQNAATIIAPAAGDTYRPDMHSRVRSDGTVVQKLLLPGLRNPAGKVQQLALVELA